MMKIRSSFQNKKFKLDSRFHPILRFSGKSSSHSAAVWKRSMGVYVQREGARVHVNESEAICIAA